MPVSEVSVAKVFGELKSIADARKEAIDVSHQMMREAQERFDGDRKAARERHREANRALVAAVNRATSYKGITQTDVAKEIGLSVQMLRHLRRQINEWEDKEAGLNGS